MKKRSTTRLNGKKRTAKHLKKRTEKHLTEDIKGYRKQRKELQKEIKEDQELKRALNNGRKKKS